MTGGGIPLEMLIPRHARVPLHEPRHLDAIIFDADLSLVTSASRFALPPNTEYTCRLSKLLSTKTLFLLTALRLFKYPVRGDHSLLPTVEASNLLQGMPIPMRATCRPLGGRQQNWCTLNKQYLLEIRDALAKCEGPGYGYGYAPAPFSRYLFRFCGFPQSDTWTPVCRSRSTGWRTSARTRPPSLKASPRLVDFHLGCHAGHLGGTGDRPPLVSACLGSA